MTYQSDSYRKNPEKKEKQCRSSFNPKLLNAAWPKAPTMPTRQSHIKTVNHKEFVKPCNPWQPSIDTEDMEVDIDDEEKEKLNIHQLKECHIKNTPDSKKNPAIINKHCKDSTRLTLRARRNLNEAEESDIQKGLFNVNEKKCEKSSETKDSTVQEPLVTSAGSTSKNSKNINQALFIVIHVSRIEIGLFKGPALSPVKVYAEKIMVQMDDEASKKNVSFRISCKAIKSLEVSLTNKPFMIKLVSPVQYLTGKTNARRSKSIPENETIILYLGYKDNVPADIKDDLKELFLVRLAEQNLWPKEEKLIKQNFWSKEEKIIEGNKSLSCSDQVNSVEPELKNEITPTKTVNSHIPTEAVSSRTIPTETENSQLVSPLQKSQKELSSFRKRDLKNSSHESSHQIKIARRCDSYTVDAMDERIKTLTHEAAHYQMLAAQQRMVIQSIETDLKNQLQLNDELTKEKGALEKLKNGCELEIATLLNDLKTERDLVKLLEAQVASYQQDILYKERVLAEKNEALQNRDEIIMELKTANSKPSNSAVDDKRTIEETRQHLMQMQVSKENLAVELDLTKIELQHAKSMADTNRTQLRIHEQENTKLRTDINKLYTNMVSLQEELVRSREQERSLTHELTELRTSHALQTERLNEEINAEKVLLAEVRAELNECRTELSKTPELVEQFNITHQKDWIIERKEICVTEKIAGVGAWGNVKVGKFRGTEVAVKQIHLLILSPHNRRLFEREMSIASRCRHPCLVQFIGATNDDGTPLLVMELLKIDLRTLLGRQFLSVDDSLHIGFDIIRALAYLHQFKPFPIIHRDISSSNILLYRNDKNWKAKLSDYGAANFVRLTMTRHPGALLYSAPEAGSIDQTSKLDVYSFGVLFCEMLIRELPVPENRQEQVASIKNSEHRKLVNDCLLEDVKKRLDSFQVLDCFEKWIT
ncbi:CAP-Gly domain-containing linker protein 1 isoform X1 [Hydra vulgaris]|uniref:CAP-Gly domain-containing linker protein 1 isoform X1 n=1 Tax=Hydra vulgaris TaxID=6087 RepID=UPI001F5F2D6B|nr:CAP-Gly domain-containing linker protein 1 [Hydra vulgaris]